MLVLKKWARFLVAIGCIVVIVWTSFLIAVPMWAWWIRYCLEHW